jgi:hypothetical protein
MRPWHEMFEELKEYKEKHGTCHVPVTKPSPEHKELGVWVSVTTVDWAHAMAVPIVVVPRSAMKYVFPIRTHLPFPHSCYCARCPIYVANIKS